MGRLLALLLLLLPDIVHYKDGRAVEGEIIARTTADITLKTVDGTIKVPINKIARIEEKPTPRQELELRRAEIADDDADALFQLARWADEQRLRRESRDLMREVLAADPGHLGANDALGRVKVDDVWMEPGDVEAYHAEKARLEAQARETWQRERAARREQAAEELLTDLAEEVGFPAQSHAGEFVTIVTDLPGEIVDRLISDLDAEVRGFLDRVGADAEDVERVVGDEIPIVLLPDREAGNDFLDQVVSRYEPFVGFRERNKDKVNYSLHWPKGVIVLIAHGDHLGRLADEDLSRTGFLAHQLGHLLTWRFKGERRLPGWIEAGMTAYFEGMTNYHASLTLQKQEVDDSGTAVGLWVNGWESFADWRDQLRVEATWNTLPPLREVLRRDFKKMDSRDVGICWSFVRFLMERRPDELVAYVRLFDSEPDMHALGEALVHDRCMERTFSDPLSVLEVQWRDWALAQRPIFPTEELVREEVVR